MLRDIRLSHFRSHKNSHIKLSRYITVIVGRSLAGKSNIARALRWLMFNRPTGDKVVSNFSSGEATEVSVSTDRLRVTHVRNDRASAYFVGDADFNRTGQSVPADVGEALNLGEINLQNQLDQHYLITSTAGQVTREINKVVGADRADIWIKAITAKINNFKRLLKQNKAEIKRKRRTLKKYQVIGVLDEIQDVIKRHAKRIDHLQVSNRDIQESLSYIKLADRAIAKINQSLGAEALIIEARQIRREISELKRENIILKTNRDAFHKYDKVSEQHRRKKEKLVYLIGRMGQCPLCLSDIDEQCIERLTEQL